MTTEQDAADGPPSARSPEQLFRWNFTTLLIDGGGFHFAVAFLSPFTLIPLFLSQLTDRAIIIGAAPSLFLLGMHLPQVVFANVINGLGRRKGYIVSVALVERVALAGMFAFAASSDIAPRASLVGFLVSYGILTICLGAMLPAYTDFVARVVVRRRGLFYGLNYLIAGSLGVVASLIARRLIGAHGDLTGLRWSFGIAVAVTVVSFLATLSLREPRRRLPDSRLPWPEYGRRLLKILADRHEFRHFLIARCSLNLGEMSPPLYAIYALAVLGLPGTYVALWTVLLSGAFASANLLWGLMGERFGFKTVLVAAGACQALAAFLALTVPTVTTFHLVFVLVGTAMAGNQIGNINMTIDFAPAGETPVYSGIVHGVQAPFVVSAPLLGGLIADLWGPATTFTLTAGLTAAGAALLTFRVTLRGRPTYKGFPDPEART